ncbi:MAG: LysM peptidoglycan-binding domain-containing protein [Psychrobacillus sp.]
MSKDDYQKKIEEHRQSIGIENESSELRRSRRNATGKKKKKKNLLLPTLFAIFILLPASFLIYVQFFYEPEKEETAEEARIEVETKPISNSNQSDEIEEEDTEQPAQTEKPEETNPVETKPEESKEVAQSTPVVAPVEKEEPKAPAPVEPKKEEKVEKPKSESKTHIVKGNETLYRIAMNYYKNPDAVEKIKAANGLASNEIYEGQKLILP